MKKKILTLVVCSSLIIFGSFVVSAGKNNQQQSQNQSIESMQQIRNRICDMLGICLGGCNLTEITGILVYDGEDFYIGDVELHFGPVWYITSATSAFDYDGDGVEEKIIDELLGLVDSQITVEGHNQSSGWMSVFSINGEVYREPGQPIWAAQNHHRWRKRNNQT